MFDVEVAAANKDAEGRRALVLTFLGGSVTDKFEPRVPGAIDVGRGGGCWFAVAAAGAARVAAGAGAGVAVVVSMPYSIAEPPVDPTGGTFVMKEEIENMSKIERERKRERKEREKKSEKERQCDGKKEEKKEKRKNYFLLLSFFLSSHNTSHAPILFVVILVGNNNFFLYFHLHI